MFTILDEVQTIEQLRLSVSDQASSLPCLIGIVHLLWLLSCIQHIACRDGDPGLNCIHFPSMCLSPPDSMLREDCPSRKRPKIGDDFRAMIFRESKFIPRHTDRTMPKLAHIQPRSTTPTTKRNTVPVSLPHRCFNPLPHNKSQNAPPLPPPPPGRRRRNHNSNTTPRTPKPPKTTPKTSFHARNKDRPEWSPHKDGMRKPFNQPQPQSILAFRLLAIHC